MLINRMSRFPIESINSSEFSIVKIDPLIVGFVVAMICRGSTCGG